MMQTASRLLKLCKASASLCTKVVRKRSGCSALRTRALATPSVETVSTQRFPFVDKFEFDARVLSSQEVIDLLSPTLTEHRVSLINRVVQDRTYDVLPIVEGAHDMGNLAAVCRSADALGCGGVHCITKGDKYKQSKRTSAGADKWLSVRVWDDTCQCLQAAKDAGYQVVVTHLSDTSVSIQDVDWTRPTAVVLGNEKFGVSADAIAMADVAAIIPMDGFVESFNISVAAALVLYEARRQRSERLGRHGNLTQEQQRILTATLMLRTVKESGSVIRSLLSRPPPEFQAHLFKGSAKELFSS